MRRLRQNEEGVVAVFIALMIVALLLLAAFVIDLGDARAKKRELRTGADAAVLAIAQDCGWNPSACTTANAAAIGRQYAVANDEDGSAGVKDLQLDTAARTVRLTTFAVDPDTGQSGVPAQLARLIGINRIEVGADAAAEWGWAGALSSLPLIVDFCTYEQVAAGEYITLVFFDGSGEGQPDESEPCQDVEGEAGQDAPGAFGWLSTNGECEAFTAWLTWADANPGQGAGRPPRDCSAEYFRENLYLKDIPVPLYDDIRGQGNITDYQIAGFAAFRVTGYKFGNASGFTVPAGYACPVGAGQVCMSGYFTGTTWFDGLPGGPNFGVLIVRLID